MGRYSVECKILSGKNIVFRNHALLQYFLRGYIAFCYGERHRSAELSLLHFSTHQRQIVRVKFRKTRVQLIAGEELLSGLVNQVF
jgi:hypothetical protein